MERMDAAELKARRFAALRQCDRILSAARQSTVREQLERLVADADGAFDLDSMPDQYCDGIVAELERRTAELLGMEEGAFFPTGTMAQQIALRCWAARTGNPAVALHPLAHPEVHERRAFSDVSGLRSVYPTTEPRLPSAAEVRELGEPFGTLMLELPLREAGFVLPSWDELCETVGAARARKAVVHLDGARLWESTPHLGRTLSEVSGLGDSVYVSFYKALGAFSGAVVAGPRDLVREMTAWRHRYGGQVYSQWPTVLAALAALDKELPRLESYVAHAKPVAAALNEAFDGVVPWFRVHPDPPHTHQFQLWLPCSAAVLNAAGLAQAEESRTSVFGPWSEPGVPGVSRTEVTVASSALEWSAADVVAGVQAWLGFVEREGKALRESGETEGG